MEMNLINNYNHTNLASNVQFNELPDWFKKAKTKNAIISFNNGEITWEGGRWQDGIWKDGLWQGGLWEGGTWEGGTWEKGVWEGGTWKDGRWEDGVWKDGTWKGGIWKDGIWKGGRWKGGRWEGGYKSIGKCKWTVMYNSFSNLIKIGCKEKTIDDWEDFFNYDRVYETKRDTQQFLEIHKAYRLAKYALENNI